MAYEPTHVNTTKPYAIVNALPSSTGLNVYPRQVFPVPSGGETTVIVENPNVVLEKPAPTVPMPTPSVSKSSSQDQNLRPTNSKKQAVTTAPSNANTKEDLLMSNFEEAWKKIQENGHRYKPSPVVPAMKPRPQAPSNAEVAPVAGHVTSRLSLVRPVGKRSRTVTPKVHRLCARCGWDATYLCSGCRTEWYCGRDCQVIILI